MRNLTDLGNAERLIDMAKGAVRYCSECKCWYVWTGKYWQKDIDGGIMRMAAKTVRAIAQEAAESLDPKSIADWAQESESKSRLNAMVELAKSLNGVAVTVAELDQNKYLLNCQNGTIDLKAGVLRPHAQSDLITHCLPYAYDPYDSVNHCKRWVQFLCEITDNDLELMSYLWRLAGLCLSGDSTEHVLNIFYGDNGRNGKTVFLSMIEKILGELAITMPFESFEPKQNSGIPNDIARMNSKRLVIASESNEGKRLDEAKIKRLTGGDRLTGRYLGCEFFDFYPTHKIVMLTNNAPIIKETGNAIWARLRLIPFKVSFEGREDKTLGEKLEAELPEILSWAVAGFAEWQKVGLATPSSVQAASKEYRSEQDTVQNFLDDCCYQNADCQVAAKELFDTFIKWAETNGERPIGKQTFNKRIKGRGFSEKIGRANMVFFTGIGLADIKYASNSFNR